MLCASSTQFILFNVQLSLSHNRPSTLLRLTHHHSLTPLPPLAAVRLSRSNSHFLIKSSQQNHLQSTTNTLQENNHVTADVYLVPPSHPWPEWSELLKSISIAGYFDVDRNIKDEFVPNESLSMEFVDAACSCLGFARNRPDILGLLAKDDIQVLINNGDPFLFKNAIETEKRMRSFLQGEESSEATTVDLMKYIVSYASNPIIYPERNINEAIESSARNLLKEIANLNNTPVLEKFNGTREDEQTPRNLEPNIIMKRGDWICRKCSFMNIAKNTKCGECKESRPHRQLTGFEWDCPRCNFFNYGKNIACLKCECSRPGSVPLPIGHVQTLPIPNRTNSNLTPFVPLPADTFAKKTENTTAGNNNEAITTNSKPKNTVSNINSGKSVTKFENRLKNTDEDEKSERWFKKVTELHDVTDLTDEISDDDFPEIMPIRKGENRFVVSKKKDRSMNSSTYKRQQAVDQGNNTSFVPFVPFPPDYFAKKYEKNTNSSQNDTNLVQETRNYENATGPETSNENLRNRFDGSSVEGSMVKKTDPLDMPERRFRPVSRENSRKATNDTNLVQETRNYENATRPETSNKNLRNGFDGSSVKRSTVKETDPLDMSEEAKTETNDTNLIQETRNYENATGPETSNKNLRNGFDGSSLEGSAVKETDPLDMSEEAKAERWFRRVAQIKDISELSQIPDEDFPSIMPMRKGVNRFVVSKRKTPLERRLMSPRYKKNLETTGSDPTEAE